MKTIVIANQKGGVGKTTTASALAAGLVRTNARVLMVDCDPQGNLTAQAGFDPDVIPDLSELLTTNKSIHEIIVRTESQGDLIGNSLAFSDADRRLTQYRAQFLLRQKLTVVSDNYDYCILDAPPSLGILSLNAFCAGDYIVVPVNAAAFSLQGLDALTRILSEVQADNPTLKIAGLLVTRYNPRTTLGKDVTETLEVIAERIGTIVFNAKIRQGVAIEAAQADQLDIFSAAPRSGVAEDYRHFITELLEVVA